MTLLYNATLVTAEKEGKGSIIIDGDIIKKVIWADAEDYDSILSEIDCGHREDLSGRHIMAGGIDAHVHFREPGLTHKADIYTESRAAAAGGVTTVFDMPNTNPPTIDAKTLKDKIEAAKDRSAVNIGFHIGATNSNTDDILRLISEGSNDEGLSPEDIAGIKVFMGSSTGNMLVDGESALEKIFDTRLKPVLVHCEDETIIRENLTKAKEEYGDNIPFEEHSNIRSRKACIKSSAKALELAIKHGTRLTLCHISTKEELEMVKAAKLINPEICAETSCNYLWFCDEAYSILGSRAKCNPALKTAQDRQALREGISSGAIDCIGSDHAPHLPEEKDAPYLQAPSGLPSIQQTLPVLLTIAHQDGIPLTRIAAVFSENASKIYNLKRGCITEGYKADLVVFDLNKEFTVKEEEQLSKCGWTPYEGEKLKGMIETVYCNGKVIYGI